MRIQVNLSDEMVSDIDSLAKKYGVSRSSLCATLIGQGVSSHLEVGKLMQNKETLVELLKLLEKDDM